MENLRNPKHHAELDQCKQKLEDTLRSRYAGFDRPALKALPILKIYNHYYKRFKKSYHVQLQLESIVLKNKSIPSVAALVEAMFMAELKDLLLTAGHDLDKLHFPVKADTATGGETYIGMSGKEQTLKTGDMYIADAEGILSSIIYGPDRRTQITPQTTAALFTTYAPPGIEHSLVQQHLGEIRDYVLLASPEAEVKELTVYGSECTA